MKCSVLVRAMGMTLVAVGFVGLASGQAPGAKSAVRMTVEMPIEIPSTVRPERSLLVRRVSKAIRTAS